MGFFLYFTTYIFFYKQEGRDKRYLIKLLKREKDELEDLYLEQTAIKRITTESVCWQHRWFTAGCGLYKTTTAMKFLLFLLLIRDTVCLFYFLWLLLLSFLYLEVWSLSEEWFMLLCYVILFDHYYLTIYFPQRYNWNIIESGVKHYNSNPNYLFASCKMYFMEKLFFFLF